MKKGGIFKGKIATLISRTTTVKVKWTATFDEENEDLIIII